jgi:hypothetical protein
LAGCAEKFWVCFPKIDSIGNATGAERSPHA